MTSRNGKAREAYVWIWLPGETEPVVAGRVWQEGPRLLFTYGTSYRDRERAIPIYYPELPLRQGVIEPLAGLSMASCLRDASPDAWGRRVILNKLTGRRGEDANLPELGELSFLLQAGSDRIGALDFQASATTYEPQKGIEAPLEDLLAAATYVERGMRLPPALDQAINHGTSIGGARPKAMIEHADRKFIAKFSASNDLYSVVKAEFLAMRLAHQCGMHVAPVFLTQTVGRDVLLIERFDRTRHPNGWVRRAIVSALTMLSLDEMMARYASYEDFAEIIRHRFDNPKLTLQELFRRICFNVLCGNTDDHARNHAAFWDGKVLSLTPAYDICPQNRSGNEASQAMLIKGELRSSTLATCLSAAPDFHLSHEQAVALIEDMITNIATFWSESCDEAKLALVDRQLFAGRQFLNEFCLEGIGKERALRDVFQAARGKLLADVA